MHSSHRLETLCLHAGQQPDPATLSRAVPVYRTSSYVFRDTRHAADLFGLKEPGNIYTRIMNPTQDILEKRVAALEGGAAALALSSGTSAVYYSIINICSSGDEIVSAANLYGGTYTMFAGIFPQFDIRVKFVDIRNTAGFEHAITEKTRALYLETIGNPVLDVADVEAVAEIAKRHHIPLIADATFTTPYLMTALTHGADIVVHSLTKWMGGHGTGIGGIVVDSGKFDWTDPKFRLYNTPDETYHGVRFATDLGEMNPLAFILRMRLVPLRNLGACISPDNAWLFLQGLETLPLRMQRHCENALAVARYLSRHPKVSWVRYPGLEADPSHETAKKYLTRGFGGMVVFGIQGGISAGKTFIERLTLFSHLANVGDAKSLALHPSSTSHSQLSEAEQRAGGLTPDLVRLSIGIEHVDDILEDLDQALKGV
ncbi:MAG: O-acetylhomoserine aminocarboxypropyltransferase/cysteine synthase [Deltaproteobacteria bacterium]|nr:O-acetylhomoserine aminocarboxypropyltransferase/cysteine synthase [Deltaproteobacteria bacterium]MBW1955773.1 O-acetylhomoserine aminocarboxypropyltransferase/cysteine synthase [Deltaproteobacteria bacterium]MBW2041085.1 O-acetylhomoserine aminocarboxypropyltransferase/cysteine synthase [Deltaproteobacteria bacterium]MBW2132233.1 O-acetylhomoserine aminocarboxypropyltransferase/cysteine synthase [Deltaproteobacteria bacterium]